MMYIWKNLRYDIVFGQCRENSADGTFVYFMLKLFRAASSVQNVFRIER